MLARECLNKHDIMSRDAHEGCFWGVCGPSYKSRLPGIGALVEFLNTFYTHILKVSVKSVCINAN